MAKFCCIRNYVFILTLLLAYFQTVVNEEVPTDRKIMPEYSFLMPAIIWDPRNPLFNCPNRGVNRINVRLNDYLIFGCPAEGKNLEWFDSASTLHTEMYENGFLTENRALMDQCNATTIPTKFMNCNNPKSPVYRTIRVAEMVASDSEPIFTSNKSYYFFGTGTGRSVNMDQKVGGRCVGEDHTSFPIHKLKLEIRVCANGEAGTASCPICLTAACYNKGCGTNTPENVTHYQKIDYLVKPQNVSKPASPVCRKVIERGCSDSVDGCLKPNVEIKDFNCPTAIAMPVCENAWKNGSEIFFNESRSCFIRRFQNCTVGTLEKHNYTKWELYRVPCPTTAPTPTTALPSAPWQNVSGELTTFTNRTRCFRLQERKYELCRRNITEMRTMAALCPSPSTTVLPTPSSSSAYSAYSCSSWSSCSAQRTTIILKSTVVSTSYVYSTYNCVTPSSAVEATSTLGLPLPSTQPRSTTEGTEAPTTFTQINGSEGTEAPITVSQTEGPEMTKAPTTCTQKKGSARSTGNKDSSDVKVIVIPIVAAVVGCLCGALAVWFYMHAKIKRVTNYNESCLDPESNLTATTDASSGMKNRGYRMSTLKASEKQDEDFTLQKNGFS